MKGNQQRGVHFGENKFYFKHTWATFQVEAIVCIIGRPVGPIYIIIAIKL